MVTREQVVKRLGQLGYVATAEDNDQIDFEMEKIINYVLNYCNIPNEEDIPKILDVRIIDRICHEFLFYKKNAGELKNFNYDAVIKQIKEGDTTIQYAVGQGEDTPENRFDSFVKQLKQGFDKWITPHRRLRW